MHILADASRIESFRDQLKDKNIPLEHFAIYKLLAAPKKLTTLNHAIAQVDLASSIENLPFSLAIKNKRLLIANKLATYGAKKTNQYLAKNLYTRIDLSDNDAVDTILSIYPELLCDERVFTIAILKAVRLDNKIIINSLLYANEPSFPIEKLIELLVVEKVIKNKSIEQIFTDYLLEVSHFEAALTSVSEESLKTVAEMLERCHFRAISLINTQSPLYAAAKHGNLPVVCLLFKYASLLRHGYPKIILGQSLMVASKAGHLAVVKELVDQGAYVNFKDAKAMTPLHTAASEGAFDIISLLLENKASIKLKDGNGKTPLHCAAESGKISSVSILLEHVRNNQEIADCINQKDDAGMTAYDIAMIYANFEIAKLILLDNIDRIISNLRVKSKLLPSGYFFGMKNGFKIKDILSVAEKMRLALIDNEIYCGDFDIILSHSDLSIFERQAVELLIKSPVSSSIFSDSIKH